MGALFSVMRRQVLRNDLPDPKIINGFLEHCYTPCEGAQNEPENGSETLFLMCEFEGALEARSDPAAGLPGPARTDWSGMAFAS